MLCWDYIYVRKRIFFCAFSCCSNISIVFIQQLKHYNMIVMFIFISYVNKFSFLYSELSKRWAEEVICLWGIFLAPLKNLRVKLELYEKEVVAYFPMLIMFMSRNFLGNYLFACNCKKHDRPLMNTLEFLSFAKFFDGEPLFVVTLHLFLHCGTLLKKTRIVVNKVIFD